MPVIEKSDKGPGATSLGVLWVVATPIGNLDDLTARARRVLAEADLVAAEDTRRTRKLLSSLGLKKELISYYEPREEKSLETIMGRLESGDTVALVTDGGTPCVSDPGYRLVREAWSRGVRVLPAPGPSALTAAISVSGLPSDRFTFAGFPPRKAGERRRMFEELKGRRDTLVFFESPKRARGFLEEALELLGDREAVVLRELTKIHETRVAGTLKELSATLGPGDERGEFTIVIAGNADDAAVMGDEDLRRALAQELDDSDEKPSKLAVRMAERTGRAKKEIYAMIVEMRSDADR